MVRDLIIMIKETIINILNKKEIRAMIGKKLTEIKILFRADSVIINLQIKK